ncbi:MAG TPA: acyl transferase [Chitinophagales bacterium]|nr:acyl transferase [Chitinophagales bacterium]
MQDATTILANIFNTDNFQFNEVALSVFQFQYTNNLVYKKFVDYLKIDPTTIDAIEKIPFLPIEFYKNHSIITENAATEKIFESSGTTDQITSKHLVHDLNLYEKSFRLCFEQFYGNIDDYTILALLPSYLERNTSSLVYMVDDLIKKTNNEHSGFYLNNLEELAKAVHDRQSTVDSRQNKILLIGVTFALLDFAEQFPMDLSDIIIMETGGMKGRREELTREEVHAILTKSFNVKTIHSEYGMTELLSQAYSTGNGIFKTPKWMKILKRDIYNPLKVSINAGRGGLNVIDLANIYSCSFIATQDLVNIISETEFEVLGRLDNADIRGCNLMVSL